MKIEIGCGKSPRMGYKTCDVRDLDTVDYVCTADNLPFDDGVIDEIYSRHLIEHFTFEEFLITLEEWNRVIKTGKILYIICPNLLRHLNQIVRGSHESLYTKERGKNDRYWGFGSLFGWQQDEHDIHKFGYYFEFLKDILEEFGFTNIEDLTNKKNSLEKAEWHLEIKAEKKENLVGTYKDTSFYKHFYSKH